MCNSGTLIPALSFSGKKLQTLRQQKLSFYLKENQPKSCVGEIMLGKGMLNQTGSKRSRQHLTVHYTDPVLSVVSFFKVRILQSYIVGTNMAAAQNTITS